MKIRKWLLMLFSRPFTEHDLEIKNHLLPQQTIQIMQCNTSRLGKLYHSQNTINSICQNGERRSRSLYTVAYGWMTNKGLVNSASHCTQLHLHVTSNYGWRLGKLCAELDLDWPAKVSTGLLLLLHSGKSHCSIRTHQVHCNPSGITSLCAVPSNLTAPVTPTGKTTQEWLEESMRVE